MTLTARELAHQLGLPPSYLRQLIRDHNLMPGHRWNERYAFEEDDVERIAGHPAVRMAVAGRRERLSRAQRQAMSVATARNSPASRL